MKLTLLLDYDEDEKLWYGEFDELDYLIVSGETRDEVVALAHFMVRHVLNDRYSLA